MTTRIFPLARTPIHSPDETADYKRILRDFKCVVPLAGHPGSFAHVRKNHNHEGIDLYGYPGESVYAIESGVVTSVFQFTGEAVGMPWWNDTWAICIKDAEGCWVYGEIDPLHIRAGQEIKQGNLIGRLKTVLKNDKGRPMTMLHLERTTHDFDGKTFQWLIGQDRPSFLLDPTPIISAMVRI